MTSYAVHALKCTDCQLSLPSKRGLGVHGTTGTRQQATAKQGQPPRPVMPPTALQRTLPQEFEPVSSADVNNREPSPVKQERPCHQQWPAKEGMTQVIIDYFAFSVNNPAANNQVETKPVPALTLLSLSPPQVIVNAPRLVPPACPSEANSCLVCKLPHLLSTGH